MTPSPLSTDAMDTRPGAGEHRAATDPLRDGPLLGRITLGAIFYVVIVSAFFLIFPGVDLWASALFFEIGTGFWATTDPFLMRLRELGPFLVKLIAIGSLLALLGALLVPRFPAWISLRAPIFFISTLALGPGILVNAILKDNWGRPRPNTVEAFGGDAPFIGVWHITDYCDRNCSFVSGEGSASFWLVALAFLAPPVWRIRLLIGITPLFLALSANRVAFGGHFLSDTMLAWGLTLLVIISVYAGLYRTRFGARLEERLRSRLGQAGQVLRAAVVRGFQLIGTRTAAFLEMLR